MTKIQTEITGIVERPDVKEQFALAGAKYQQIVKDANIKAE